MQREDRFEVLWGKEKRGRDIQKQSCKEEYFYHKLEYSRFRVPFLLFAALVATSRVLISSHYVSDVLMGSYIGILVTFCFYAWFFRKGYLEDSAEK